MSKNSGDGHTDQGHININEPRLLRNRTDEYFVARIAGEYKGMHPMKSLTPDASAIQMRNNDYLCLAKDKRVVQAVVNSLQNVGHGDAISRVWVHNQPSSLNDFEHRMATLMEAEDGVLCASGYAANVGLIQAIAKPDTPIYIDMFAHLSLWEGVSSAKATARPFRHNDAKHLRTLISRYGPGLVVVDSLYSTTGNFCLLEEIVEVATEGECIIIVDETHSFGTHGKDGAGLVVEKGLSDRVHFRTVGLSKAVASRGGIVICSERNAEFIRYEAYPAIFSTSVLPHEVAGYNVVLDILKTDQWRRDHLHANHAYLVKELAALGYNVADSKSQIISLEPGDYEKTILLRDALEKRGLFGSIFFPPASPRSRCSIRLTVNCSLTEQQLERSVEICRDIRDEVRLQEWSSTLRLQRQKMKAPELKLSKKHRAHPKPVEPVVSLAATEGSEIVKEEPTPSLESHSIVPPIEVTT